MLTPQNELNWVADLLVREGYPTAAEIMRNYSGQMDKLVKEHQKQRQGLSNELARLTAQRDRLQAALDSAHADLVHTIHVREKMNQLIRYALPKTMKVDNKLEELVPALLALKVRDLSEGEGGK